MKLAAMLTIAAAAAALGASAQQPLEVKLWDNATAPHSNGITQVEQVGEGKRISHTTEAVLYIYRPAAGKATGQAVVVCPGGGYWIVAMSHEGDDVGRWFAEHGITAAVLKYRMPNGHPEVPMEDAAEAMRYMREEYAHKDEARQVGIMGFSAGGHLAAATGVGALAKNLRTQDDPRPDFMLLFYPVISSSAGSHGGSYDNLLGKERTAGESRRWSPDLLVDDATPPALIILSDDDNGVPPVNSTLMYNALKDAGHAASLHILPEGGHGWGINETFRYRDLWQTLTLDWLGYIAPGSR